MEMRCNQEVALHAEDESLHDHKFHLLSARAHYMISSTSCYRPICMYIAVAFAMVGQEE